MGASSPQRTSAPLRRFFPRVDAPRHGRDVIDTHAHLDPAEAPAGARARAREAGVDRVIAIATIRDPGGPRRSHSPNSIKGSMRASASIRTKPRRPAISTSSAVCLGISVAVALGETGLDYFRDYAPHDAQRLLFDRQTRACVGSSVSRS